MAVTAILSLKGGTGKTTTALNLGAALAIKGYRVLLIDMDPQASLTWALGLRRGEVTPTLADVLLGNESIHDVLWKPKQENLFLCPSDLRLLGLQQDPAAIKRAARKLHDSLKAIKRRNSQVLIDCPPGLSALSQLALQAADHFLVPTLATPLACEALRSFLRELEEGKSLEGVDARLIGILLTMVNPYLRVSVDTLKELRTSFRKDLLRAIIRQSVRIAESPGLGQTIFEHADDSVGAENYRRLAKEFLHRLGS